MNLARTCAYLRNSGKEKFAACVERTVNIVEIVKSAEFLVLFY